MSNLSKTGIVGPFQLSNTSLVLRVSESVLGGLAPMKDRHTDNADIREIFFDDVLQQKVTEYFGTELLLWRSNFFVKKIGSPEIGWHHDRHFENGNSPLNFSNLENHFSILIGLTDIESGNGDIEYIPGSHLPRDDIQRDLRPFHQKELSEHFIQLPESVQRTAQKIPLKQGQFVLFHSGLLHYSKPFNNGNPRVSMIGRLVKRGTEVPTELAKKESIIRFN